MDLEIRRFGVVVATLVILGWAAAAHAEDGPPGLGRRFIRSLLFRTLRLQPFEGRHRQRLHRATGLRGPDVPASTESLRTVIFSPLLLVVSRSMWKIRTR